MGIRSLIVLIIVGAIAGWLAEKIVKIPMGLLGNIVTGILGAFIAGLILPRIGLALGGGIFAAIIHATIGAVILLYGVKLLRTR
jgi:uncharacterized membrane protein YeaQ/YmgE (transglycosylase-associated protein family)